MTEFIEKTENKLFKWITPIIFGILITLTSVIYSNLTLKDASADNRISVLESNDINKSARLQNLEANVYIICKAQRLNCIPPIK